MSKETSPPAGTEDPKFPGRWPAAQAVTAKLGQALAKVESEREAALVDNPGHKCKIESILSPAEWKALIKGPLLERACNLERLGGSPSEIAALRMDIRMQSHQRRSL